MPISLRSGLLAGTASVAALITALAVAQEAQPDPFLWLEEVTGSAALQKVQQWNERTERELTADPGYATRKAQADAILGDPTRLVLPTLVGNDVYRLWQDKKNPRGIWQRTSAASFRGGAASWEDVLDLDALGAKEGKNWYWHGATCRPQGADRCLVELAEDNKDTSEIREYDVRKRAFVPGGITVPASKRGPTHLEATDLPMAWLDGDSALVTHIWRAGEATAAGYGFVVKRVVRGKTLDQAEEMFRGKPTDVSAMPLVFRDGDGKQVAMVSRRLDFFRVEYHVLTPRGPVLLPLPQGVTMRGLLKGKLLVTLRESWTRGEATFPAGAVVAFDVDTAVNAPDKLKPELVIAPSPRQAIDQVKVTHGRALIALYDEVEGKLLTAQPAGTGWKLDHFPAPEKAAISIVATTPSSDAFHYVVESYLTPSTLFAGDAATGKSSVVASAKPQFDASQLVLEKFDAPAADGERIPYYVARPKSVRFDGKAPTLLCAYGGLGYILAPHYYPVTGKLWLERGGSFVIAHIRGGGEFGPRWHEAGKKDKRQTTFDDLVAVAKDLEARKLTSQPYLGIRGSSNGGYLMGVEFTQHPEMWNAALLNVGLYDMLRYPKMLAGASWMSEFGNPDDPVEGAFLRRVSPYQNLRAGLPYPPPLLMTSTSDNRVHPGHARKFAAKLEQLGVPFYYNEVPTGGHGGSGEGGPCGSTERAPLEFTYFAQRLMTP